MADPREEKLPRWAQDDLNSLRAKIESQAIELAVARNEAPMCDATGKVIADGMGREGFPLRDRATVTFHLPNGKVSVMLREHGTLLDLNCSGTMLIMPRAANSAYLKLEASGR